MSPQTWALKSKPSTELVLSCKTAVFTITAASQMWCRPHEAHLTLNGQNIPIVNHVKHLRVIFGKRIMCKLHIEMIEAKAFRTLIRIYSILKSERSSANIKLTLHKALIRSVMTYACPAWEWAVETYLLKLQLLQYKILRTTGNFPRCAQVSDLHTAFNLPCVYDDITKLCRQHAEVLQNYENEHIRGIGQGEARHRKWKELNLVVVKLTTVQVNELPL
jgi:hypothetical protein